MTEQYKKDRVALLKAMHTIISDMNHENAYLRWINFVPDGATEEDFEDMAMDDDDMETCVKFFATLFNHYGKYGLVVQGDWDQHEFKCFGQTEDLDEEDE